MKTKTSTRINSSSLRSNFQTRLQEEIVANERHFQLQTTEIKSAKTLTHFNSKDKLCSINSPQIRWSQNHPFIFIFKATVYSKMNICLSFAQLHVNPNLYDFCRTQNRIFWKQNKSLRYLLKYLLLCSAEENLCFEWQKG